MNEKVGIIGGIHFATSMIHRLDCWHFKDRPQLNPRSAPFSIKEAQALRDEINMAVCLVCDPPVTGGRER